MALINPPQGRNRQRGTTYEAIDRGLGQMFQLYMHEESKRMQMESSVLDMMAELDPVKLISDNLMMEQRDRIQTLEDKVTNKFKTKKHRYDLSPDDILEFRYEANETKNWQAKQSARMQVIQKEATAIINDQKSGAPKYDTGHYDKLLLEYMNSGSWPAQGTMLKIRTIDLDTYLATQKLFNQDQAVTSDGQPQLFGDNGEYTRQDATTRWGPQNGKDWLKVRQNYIAGQYYNNDVFRESAMKAFYDDNYTTPIERQTWIGEANRLNQNRKVDDPVLGIKGDREVSPDFLWLQSYAPQKVQPDKVEPNWSITPKYAMSGDSDTDTEAISWAGEPDKIETTISYPSSSGTKDVTYSSEDTATLTEVKLGGGADAARINVAGDYFVIGGNVEGNLIGKSINEEGLKSTLRGNTYQLAAKPRIKKGMRVYMGDDVELEGFITKDRGRKGKLIGGDENLKLVHGMPIDDETWEEIKKEAKGGNEVAQKIIDNSPQKNVAHIEIKTGAYDTAKLLRVYDKDLANELGTEFFEYEESENDNWWEK